MDAHVLPVSVEVEKIPAVLCPPPHCMYSLNCKERSYASVMHPRRKGMSLRDGHPRSALVRRDQDKDWSRMDNGLKLARC